ncbi:thioredoxin domain-containing protein [Dyadobacter chenhuakuii]|uniref:Thioredoxin domain-containing protein n=1 Tax=Dyadobacter chenhuakuii TaxID=2909339 RepID=A0A9X1QEE0_9BACT|nr:thioredoxin domain-containing protein [Dyadobacter chenhuakuii]MCF2498798.1 thioredoxin domain-containing protein [Dyadobacter chenhuakuii]
MQTTSLLKILGMFCIVLVAICSCEKQAEKRIVAVVEGEAISLEEVDKLIKNSLYEYLFAIYDVRRIALNELINSRMISKEAKALHVRVDSVTSLRISEMKQKLTKDQYVSDNALQHGVVDEENPFKLIPLHTEEGQRILEKSYVKFLNQMLNKELSAKYRVKISLEPPETPKLDLRGTVTYARRNMQSLNVVTIVSDFDCPVCQSKVPVFKQLFMKYGDRVRFEYVHLSPSISKSILFSACAAKQGKFWEAHDLLFRMGQNGSQEIESLMTSLNLDPKACKACMESDKVADEINASMEQLRALGIKVTPTIIINNRIYYGEISEEVMGQFIEKSLK